MVSVLLVAPSVDGGDVGEAWVAYQWAKRLGERHRVTLLTHRKRSRPSAIEQLPGVEVVEWVEPPLIGRAERFNSLVKPWYPLFHRNARRWIRSALDSGRTFDVGHQPVPVAMRYPSPLAKSGISYVLGPVGGGLSTPPGFAGDDTAPWYVDLRRFDALRLRRDPVLRHTYEHAATVAGIAPYVQEMLAPLRLRDFVVMSETALEELPPAFDRDIRPGPVRLLFVGRLIRTKGARDAVRAMRHLRDLPVMLDIVGDGFDRDACESLAAELGLREVVIFHGAQPRHAVESFYRDADVFVFPSYREPGGNVQLEAMGHGLPLIVADRGGPGAAVSRECAFAVHPTEPEQYAADIAAAIRTLVTHPELRLRMGAVARSHVRDTGTWSQRISQMEGVFADVLRRRA